MNLPGFSSDQPAERPCRTGNGGNQMIARVAIVIASLLVTAPAMAESLSPEAAQRFVTGKLFAFSCFEGTRGLGQIHGDGSANRNVQGEGQRRLRHAQGPVIRAVLQSRPNRRSELPRLAVGSGRLHAL